MRRFTWIAACLCACGLSTVAAAQESPAMEIFNQLDKNQDGKITPEEVPAAQMRFFERLLRIGDKDEDGILTREEFLHAVDQEQEEDRPAAPAERGRGFGGREGVDPASLFGRLDQNRDGKLTRDEIPGPYRERFGAIFDRLGKEELTRDDLVEFARQRPAGERPGSGERRDPERMRTPQEGERGPGERRPPFGSGRPGVPPFFRILDADGNGRVSKGEMLNAIRLFEELDLNGDGELDLPELMGFAPGREGSGPPRREPSAGTGGRFGRGGAPPEGMRRPGGGGFNLEGFLDRYDADGDGFISKEEAPEWLGRNFDELDGDGDGKLSPDEIREMMRRRGSGSGGGRFQGSGPEREGERPQRPARPEF